MAPQQIAPPDTVAPQASPAVGRNPEMPAAKKTGETFHDQCRNAVAVIQAAIRRVYGSLDLPVDRPQDVSRRLGVDKNLSWKLARVAGARDPLAVAAQVPGAEAFRILTDKLRLAGVNAKELGIITAAAETFDRMVLDHAGDRPTLQILLDGLSLDSSLEQSRKALFRGASGVWGIQAKARVTSSWIAPNETNPDRIDLAIVGGLLHIRRLRPLEGWPLFRFGGWNEEGRPLESNTEPLEEPSSPDEPRLLMRSWCSPLPPPVVSRFSGGAVTHELAAGPVGKTGDSTFYFGSLQRSLGDRYSGKGELTEIFARVTLPIEMLFLDLFVHRDLREYEQSFVEVYGGPFETMTMDEESRMRARLPLEQGLVRSSNLVAATAHPQLPGYDTLVPHVFKRCGWQMRDFRLLRLQMTYPPMPSMVVVRTPQLQKP